MTAFPTIDLPEIGNINVQSQTHINHNYRTDIAPTSNKFFSLFEMEQERT